MDDSPSLDQLESPSWPVETLMSHTSAKLGNFVNEDSAPPLCLDLGDSDNNWTSRPISTRLEVSHKGMKAWSCSTTPTQMKRRTSLFRSSLENSPTLVDESLIHSIKTGLKSGPDKVVGINFPVGGRREKCSLETGKVGLGRSPPGLTLSSSPFGSQSKIGNLLDAPEGQIGPLSTLFKDTLGTSSNRNVVEEQLLGTSLQTQSRSALFFTTSTENLSLCGLNTSLSRKSSFVSMLQEEALAIQNGKARNFGIFGNLPVSADLSPEELSILKKEILFPKNFSSTSDVINFDKLNKMKLLNPQSTKAASTSLSISKSNSIAEEMFEMESEKNGTSSSPSERHKTSPDVDNLPEVSPLEKLSAYLFNQPFAQNWFFNKSGDEESRNSNDSLEEQPSEQNSSENQAFSCPPEGLPGEQLFMTRPRTFPFLEDVNDWDPKTPTNN